MIAFLALFVSIAGGHLWAIICFALHQVRSTLSDRDGLHHQQQALLRNAPNSSTASWMLLKLGWAWKNKTPYTVRRTIFLAVPAITHLAAVSIAGIFSSRLALSGDEVLIRSTSCGWMSVSTDNRTTMDSTELLDAETAGFAIGRWIAVKSLQYAWTCYNQTNLADYNACNLYTTPSINVTVNNRVPCPFGGNICGLPRAISVDTGLVDSNAHLGINSGPLELPTTLMDLLSLAAGSSYLCVLYTLF
jgi:hypothetical protein